MSNRWTAISNTDHCRTGQSGTNTMFCSYFAFLRLSCNVINPSPLASIVSASSRVALKLIVPHHSWSGNDSSSFCSHCRSIQCDRSESQLRDNFEYHLRWCHTSASHTVCQYVWQTTCLSGMHVIYSKFAQVGVTYQSVRIAVHVDRDCVQHWFSLCFYLCPPNRCSLCLRRWC